jgi:isoleucyl-tRNA synthetase
VIQQARREKGLDVSDRIRLTIDAPEGVLTAARTHEGLIRSETLAVEVGYGGTDDGVIGKVGDGVDVRVGIVKAG